jgi:hypothetical protein
MANSDDGDKDIMLAERTGRKTLICSNEADLHQACRNRHNATTR